MTNIDTDMKNGLCPKCGATDVRLQPSAWGRYDRRNFISINFWGGGARVHNYVCVACGYLESYIDTADIKKVAEKWEPIAQAEPV